MSKAKDAATSAPQEILPPLPVKGGRGNDKAKAKKAEPNPEDAEFDGLMAEVESDLREEELRKLWERYGKTVIVAMIVLVLAVAGAQIWRQRVAEQRLELAARYEQALKDVADGKTDDAAAIFADVAAKRGEGYATLSQFERAALLLQKNDTAGAVAVYKDVAADTKADQAFRDLATVLIALHSIDTAEPKSLDTLLAPLTTPANPFHNAATELQALLAAKQGDTARAAKLAQQVIDDPTTPQNMRARAEDLAAYYKTGSAAAAPAASATTTPAAPPSAATATPPPAAPKP